MPVKLELDPDPAEVRIRSRCMRAARPSQLSTGRCCGRTILKHGAGQQGGEGAALSRAAPLLVHGSGMGSCFPRLAAGNTLAVGG